MEHAAWQIARAARYKGTIYSSDFDGTERIREAQRQTPEEMLVEAEKIEAAWPHNKSRAKAQRHKETLL